MDHDRTAAPRFVILCLMALAAVAALLMPAAYFTIDEAHYHLMADGLVDGFRFDIPNRLDSSAAPEMTPFLAVDVNGQITSQYPHVYAFLAAPFQLAFGLRGLYLLNAAAYMVVLLVTYQIAVRLLRDRAMAALACGVFAFGTYSLQYAAAIWPHILAVAFVVVAILAALRSNECFDRPSGLLWAGMAGLCIGIGTGVRLDVAFAALATAALIMLERRWMVRGALCAAGTMPGLVAIATINFVKFGSPSPFSYGVDRGGYDGSVLQYVPIIAALAAAIGLVAAGPLVRGRRRQTAGSRVASYAPLIAGVVGSGVLAALWVHVGPRFFEGLLQIVVDLRLRSFEIIEPAMVRTADGGVFYHLSAKKALLQSCPFLLVVGLDALRRLRNAGERRATTILLMPAAVYIPIFSYFAWHGGLAYNMRYLTPILPFVAILAAQTFMGLLRELSERARPYVASIWPVSAIAICVLGFGAIFGAPHNGVLSDQAWSEGHALWMLRLPLWIAVIAALCWLLRLTAPAQFRVAATTLTAATFAVALGSSSVAALAHDLVRTVINRAAHHAEAAALSSHLPSGSLLVTPGSGPHLYVLLADRGIHLAAINPALIRPLRVLAEPYERQGRETYLFAGKPVVDGLCEQGALDDVELRQVGTHGDRTLYRIGIAASGSNDCAADQERGDQDGGGRT
jgi:hypothetical protein